MGKTVKKYFRLYKGLVSQFFKVMMQSKVDFIMGLAGFFFTQILGLAFLFLVFRQIPSLNGWTLEQLVFIYGLAQIPRGIDHLFTDNIWLVAYRYVINGDFDRYMLRPMNILFQVISEKLQPDAVGELAMGTVLVVRALVIGVVSFDVPQTILFIISMFAGALIYTSIKLFFASLAFWLKQSGPFLQLAYEMADFAKYPIEIYHRTIRFIITWIIPFAFVAYLPALYFMDKGPWYIILTECVISVVLWVIAYATFKRGTMIYESAGN